MFLLKSLRQLLIIIIVAPALFGCVELVRDKFDSWIGHDWHELAGAGWDCSPGAGTVECPSSSLTFTLDGNTITGWRYHPGD